MGLHLSCVAELKSLHTLVLDNSFDGEDLIGPEVFEQAKNLRHLSIDEFPPYM